MPDVDLGGTDFEPDNAETRPRYPTGDRAATIACQHENRFWRTGVRCLGHPGEPR
jgi:hypothetical protein